MSILAFHICWIFRWLTHFGLDLGFYSIDSWQTTSALPNKILLPSALNHNYTLLLAHSLSSAISLTLSVSLAHIVCIRCNWKLKIGFAQLYQIATTGSKSASKLTAFGKSITQSLQPIITSKITYNRTQRLMELKECEFTEYFCFKQLKKTVHFNI